MRKLSLILLSVLVLGCSKDDEPEVFTSITGFWIVRTPDNATNITFRIGVNSNNEYIVETAGVNHNGSDYTAQPIDAGLFIISPKEIESITFRTTDFIIRLLNISVNNTFTELEISNSILLFDGIFREFAMMKATRK